MLDKLMQDKILKTQIELTRAMASALSQVPQEDTSTQLLNSLNGYTESLKERKHIEYASSITMGEPYIIEGYHLTKHGLAIEHHKEIRSLVRTQVPSTEWWLRKLSGPHRSRRLIHKKAKFFLKGERQPVDINIQPVVPMNYVSVTIEVKNEL
jgi:hypothetical protein